MAAGSYRQIDDHGRAAPAGVGPQHLAGGVSPGGSGAVTSAEGLDAAARTRAEVERHHQVKARRLVACISVLALAGLAIGVVAVVASTGNGGGDGDGDSGGGGSGGRHGGGGGGGNGSGTAFPHECEWAGAPPPVAPKAASGEAGGGEVRFLHLSDLHLDPRYETGCRPSDGRAPLPLGVMGCDTPAALLDATLAKAAEVASAGDGARFAVLSGDFVAHDPPAGTALDTLRAATAAVRRAMPAGVTVLPMLGNNDMQEKDYCLPYGDTPWLSEVAEVWADWLRPFDAATNATGTFRAGGFYAAVPVPGVRVLVLNTVLYSARHEAVGCGPGGPGPAPAPARPEDPDAQLAWVRAQLAEARRADQRVLLAGHIPPGNNGYDGVPLWHAQYVNSFFAALHGFEDLVDAGLYGHLHRDDFRASGNCSVSLLTGSVSPIFANNPSFRELVAAAGADGRYAGLQDYTQWALALEAASLGPANRTAEHWFREYTFSEAYGGERPNPAGLRRVLARLGTEPALGAAYIARRSAQALPQTGEYLCAASTDSLGDYTECVARLPPRKHH